jgi:hypothetical protein
MAFVEMNLYYQSHPLLVFCWEPSSVVTLPIPIQIDSDRFGYIQTHLQVSLV